VTALDAWHDTYRLVTGAPFPFFFADCRTSVIRRGLPSCKQLTADFAPAAGIRFGIIYIGDTQDNSDAEWDEPGRGPVRGVPAAGPRQA